MSLGEHISGFYLRTTSPSPDESMYMLGIEVQRRYSVWYCGVETKMNYRLTQVENSVERK